MICLTKPITVRRLRGELLCVPEYLSDLYITHIDVNDIGDLLFRLDTFIIIRGTADEKAENA